MNAITLDELMKRTQDGRALSPAAAKADAEDFFYQSFSTALHDAMSDGFEDYIKSLLCAADGEIFLDSMERLRKISDRVHCISADLLMSLCFTGSIVNNDHPLLENNINDCPDRNDTFVINTHPLFERNIKDYLDLAGRDDLYERWFEGDCIAWQRTHEGKLPRIGDILYECIRTVFDCNFSPSDVVRLLNWNDNFHTVSSDKITEPFRRPLARKYSAPLIASWTYIIFAEVPHYIFNCDSKEDKGYE